MSTLPVQTGFWRDYTREGVHSWTLTLKTRWSGFLLASLATFVGMVGTSFWSLLSFALHQLRVKSGEADVLYFQHQVVLRNPATPLHAMVQFLKTGWAWRAQHSRRRLAPRRLKSRTLLLLLPALLVFIGFTVAGIFVGDLTRPAYGSDNIKIKPLNCGQLSLDTETPETFSSAMKFWKKNMQAAKVYARDCYEATTASSACGVYPQKSLPISQTNLSCPFGRDSKGHSLCTVGSALNLDTGLLDTNDFLGINAPPESRILLRRSSTCSPINATEYAKPRDQPTTGNHTTWDYYFGPVDLSLGSKDTTAFKTNYTHTYDTSGMYLHFPYRLFPFSDELGWEPIIPLAVPNASTTLLLLEANSINYFLPVKDAWFSANKLPPSVLDGKFFSSSTWSYQADSLVSAMACIDQYQLCNSATSPFICTILGRFGEVFGGRAILQINLSKYQVATALVAANALPNTWTHWIVSNLGVAPLLAQELVQGTSSSAVPENQWQLEVQNWFRTGLAHLQASVLAHPVQPKDLGPGVTFEPVNATDSAAREVCSNLRIKNTGAYQSFSTLGLIIILAIGIPIIVLSWTVEDCVAASRKRRRLRYRRLPNHETADTRSDHNDNDDDRDVDNNNDDEHINNVNNVEEESNIILKPHPQLPNDNREIARVADCILQLQRKALAAASPQTEWEWKMQMVPVTVDPFARFSVPKRVEIERSGRGRARARARARGGGRGRGMEEGAEEGTEEAAEDDGDGELEEKEDEEEDEEEDDDEYEYRTTGRGRGVMNRSSINET